MLESQREEDLHAEDKAVMEAGAGGMWPPARECPEQPGVPEADKHPPQSLWQDCGSADTFVSDLGTPGLSGHMPVFQVPMIGHVQLLQDTNTSQVTGQLPWASKPEGLRLVSFGLSLAGTWLSSG